jgi:hypothetical protein
MIRLMTINIHHKHVLVGGFVLLAGAAVFFSLRCQTVGTVLSVLGSIASLYAIIEALVHIKSIKDETQSIKNALSEKIATMNLKETTEQINKHIEIVSRIPGFIGARNHDASVILMEQMLVFLQSLKCNPTTDSSDVKEIQKYIKVLKIDLNNVRVESAMGPNGAGLNYSLLTKHFTELEGYLTQVSQQNHFRYD